MLSASLNVHFGCRWSACYLMKTTICLNLLAKYWIVQLPIHNIWDLSWIQLWYHHRGEFWECNEYYLYGSSAWRANINLTKWGCIQCFLTLLQGHNSYFRQLVILWMLLNKNNVQGKTKDRIGVHNIYDDGFMVSSLITKCTGSL